LNPNNVLTLIDPAAWLIQNTGWTPFTYEAEILRAQRARTRIIKKSRQIGVTTTISKEAVWKALTMNNRLILIVSPSGRQSQQPMSIIHSTVDSAPALYEHLGEFKSRSEITFDNGSRILSLPNSPSKIRTYAANDIYLDEAAHFENDAEILAVVGPMLTATHGTLTMISTPFGRRGMFYEQYKHACEMEPVDPENVKVFDLYPSSISPLIGKEGLERERISGLYTELEFRQEFLGEFLEEVDVYLTLDLIMACVNSELQALTESQPQKRYYWGVDFAKKRDETAVVILEKIKMPDGSTRLVTCQWFSWAKMDYSDQIGRLGQLKNHLPCAKGIFDQSGVGEPVMEDIKRVIPNAEGVIYSDTIKLDLLGRLRVWMESTQRKKALEGKAYTGKVETPAIGEALNTLELPNDKKLIMQLNSITYEVSKTGRILFREEEKAKIHSDLAWALAMAVAAASEPEMVVQDLF
jgi:phage FluMu gp28-like protein